MTQIGVVRDGAYAVRIDGLTDVATFVKAITELDEADRAELALLLTALEDRDREHGTVSRHDGERYSPGLETAEKHVDVCAAIVTRLLAPSAHITVGRSQAVQAAADLDELLTPQRSAA